MEVGGGTRRNLYETLTLTHRNRKYTKDIELWRTEEDALSLSSKLYSYLVVILIIILLID